MSLTKEQYNTVVLNNIDPHLAQIFFTSSICNVYQYNLGTGEWDKLEIQGSLFLFSRSAGDDYPYAAMVLNRLNNKNFTLGITPRHISVRKNQDIMDVKIDDPLIMVQASTEEIYGLWLYDEQDRQKCLSLIDWCIQNGTS